MKWISFLGRTGKSSFLREVAVLQRMVSTMEGHGREKEVPCSLVGDREQEMKLLQPLTHVLQVPGKQFRSRLSHAYNYWLKVPADKLSVVKEITHMLHYSFVLIDDILDNAVLRRGIPVAHSVYGVASTINAANYLLIKGLKRVVSLNHPDAITVCLEGLLETYYGQGLEIFWRDNYMCPSLEEYKQMVKKKTEFVTTEPRLMQLLSDNKIDFSTLNSILVTYLQIRDDYCNLCLQQYTKDKGYCDDMTEGKFSFPIIHAIKSHPDDHQVMRILQQRTRDLKLKKYCVTLLEKFGSLSYTRCTLEELDAEVRAEVAKLGGNPLLVDILDELLNWKRETGDKNPEQ